MANHLPVLVVSGDSATAALLAEQLQHAGFPAETATSCRAAHTALLARFYGSLICFVDQGIPSDLDCLSALRQRSPRTWLILITPTAPVDARALITHCGADALLVGSFSMDDLVSRLVAFARRSRPQEG